MARSEPREGEVVGGGEDTAERGTEVRGGGSERFWAIGRRVVVGTEVQNMDKW